VKQHNIGKSDCASRQSAWGCNNFGWEIDEAASKKSGSTAPGFGHHPVRYRPTFTAIPGRLRKPSLASAGSPPQGRHRRHQVRDHRRGDEPSRRHIFNSGGDQPEAPHTEWIDIYMMHFPDPTTPMEETCARWMTSSARAKVRYIGCRTRRSGAGRGVRSGPPVTSNPTRSSSVKPNIAPRARAREGNSFRPSPPMGSD